MQFQDYYQLLGVARDADADAIKRAYRKLALKWHPDRHSGAEKEEAETRFKRISEAYEVLSDPEKRARYDRFGENWQHGQDFTPPEGSARMSPEEFAEMFGGGGGFSEFFQSFFGDQERHAFRGRPRTHARFRRRGADVRAELELGIAEALAGGKQSFQVMARAACPRCGGVGFVEEHVCPTCGGVGAVRMPRQVELRIPPDVRDGLVLRLAGLGEAGQEGGEAGDLLLTLRLADDERYRRVGDVLETEAGVAPWDALLGTTIDLPTPGGTARLRIPPRTRAGQKLRLRGMGLVRKEGGRGDLHAVVRLVLPEALTERQRELMGELREEAQKAGGGPT